MPISRSRVGFRKDLLPSPATFWKDVLATRSRASRGWIRSRCPIHKGANPTSFVANLETGGFFCHACGVKGGDILDFIRLRHGYSFKEAAAKLGAWSDQPLNAIERERLIQERQQSRRIIIAAQRLAAQETALRKSIAGELRFYQQLQRRFAQQLQQCIADDSAWQALAALFEIIRRLKVQHAVLLVGSMQDRVNFVTGDEQVRNSITDRLLFEGWLRDDHGRHCEVVV